MHLVVIGPFPGELLPETWVKHLLAWDLKGIPLRSPHAHDMSCSAEQGLSSKGLNAQIDDKRSPLGAPKRPISAGLVQETSGLFLLLVYNKYFRGYMIHYSVETMKVYPGMYSNQRSCYFLVPQNVENYPHESWTNRALLIIQCYSAIAQ